MINLAIKGKKEKPVKIEVNFPKDMKHELIALLKEFKEIFTWYYQDILGLDTEIVVHRISVKSECPPSVASPLKNEVEDYSEDQRRSGKTI